jgi:hypothetical protein
MTRLLPRWPIFFLALVPLLVLWPTIFGGQAIGPWDHIRSMAPWNGPKPQTPWDVLQADGVLQFAPWRSLVFDAWSHGQIPAWNNYQLMGTPLLANSQSAGFYPLHIMMGVLHIPLYPAMTFLAWFHLFWAGLGSHLLVRRLGGTKIGGAIAGASFAMSAFMVYWTALPSVITTVSWIPWVLACTLGMFQYDPLWGIAENSGFRSTNVSPHDAVKEALAGLRARAGWTVGLITSVAMMILAGHLQFLAFGLIAAFVVAVVLTIKLLIPTHRRPIKVLRHLSGSNIPDQELPVRTITRGPLLWTPGLFPFARFAFAIVIAMCIAAPQLLPVLQFGKQSHRRSPPTSEGYAAYTGSAIQPWEWAGLEFPKMIGDPSESAGDPNNLSLFWSAFVKRGDNFGESALAIGPVVLLLLCLLPRAGWKRGTPIALVGLLGILIACGTPIDYLLYYLVPGWSSTGSPGRAIVLFVLAASCLAGLAITPERTWNKTSMVRGLIGFVALSGIWFVGSTFVFENLKSFVPSDVLTSMIMRTRAIDQPMFLITILLTLGVGAILVLRPKRAKIALLVAAPVVPLLLALGVLRFGTPIDPVVAPSSYDRVAYLNDGWNLVTTPHATMAPNMASLLRIHDLGGYDSLLDKDTKAMLDAANHQDSSPPENGNMMFIKNSADPGSLTGLGVGAFRRVSSTGGVATITSEGYRSISVQATGPGLLSLKDRNMPGWTVTVNGKPAEIHPGLFREIDLPAGIHQVEFKYWPPGLTAGLVLFLLGFLPFLAYMRQWRGTQSVAPRN